MKDKCCMHGIKTYGHVSATKEMKIDAQHTSVLFTGNVKLPISIFKTTKLISTKFIYLLRSYTLATSHIKIES